MVSTLLTILKILLIVIAAIVALLITLALIIVFVPVRYRVKADKSTADSLLTAKAKVSFLLHIFTVFVSYEDELSYGVKIFGIKLGKKDVISDSVPADDDLTIEWNEDAEESYETPQAAYEELEEEAEDDEADDEDDDEDDLADKISEFIEKITGKYDETRDKYDRIRKDIRFWKKMADDKRNKEAVALIKKEALRILKKIAPRKIKGFVHFGFEDPATTGRILMYLALVYPVLPRKFKIDPSFEDTDIFGSIDVKGHICLIVPAISFLRVFFNKDCKRMYRLYKRHSEKKN